jgi:hypothetical protein
MRNLITILFFCIITIASKGQKSPKCMFSVDSFHVVKPSCDTCCNGSITCYPKCGATPYQYYWHPSGATGQTLNNVCYSSNYIYCIVTDSNGYRTIDSVVVSKVNQVQQFNMPLIITSAYPNPNNGKFNIEIQNVNTGTEIEIYNMLGERVYAAPLNPPVRGTSTTTISLPYGECRGGAGIYFYRITSEKGEFVGSGKLVIE